MGKYYEKFKFFNFVSFPKRFIVVADEPVDEDVEVVEGTMENRLCTKKEGIELGE